MIRRLLLFIAASVAVVLLVVAARGPALLQEFALVQLASFGVEELGYENLQLTRRELRLEHLRLAGLSDATRFDIHVPRLLVTYRWQELLAGRVTAVSAETVEIAASTHAPAGADPEPGEPAPLNLAGLLPASLTGQLPLERLLVERLSVDWTAPGGLVVPVRGRLEVAEATRLVLAGTWQEFGFTVGATADQATPLELRLAVAGEGQLLAQLTARLDQAAGDRWEWLLEGGGFLGPGWPVVRELSGLPESALLDGELDLAGTLQHPPHLLLTATDWRALLAPLSADFALGVDLTQARWPGSVDGGRAMLRGDVSWANGQLAVDLRPSSISVQAKAAEEPLQLSLPEFSGSVDWLPGELPALDLAGQLAVGLKQGVAPLLALQLSGTPAGESLQVLLSLTDDSAALSLDAGLATVDGSRVSDTRATLRADDLALLNRKWLPFLGTLVPKLKPLPQFSAGKLQLRLFPAADWNPDGLRSELALEGVAGRYDEYRIAGLDLSGAVEGIERFRTTRPLRLDLASLFAGFEVADTVAVISVPTRTDLASPRLYVEQFTASLFGGRVYLPEPTTWDFSASTNAARLRADDWQLASVVALQTGQDIEANGVLEGELPISWSDGRLLIEGGYMKARAPGGLIRYRAAAGDALGAGSAQLALALNLLDDFRYQTLDTRVELDKDGNLLLRLSLAGSNPAQYQGRPVQFNINLEQDIDPLLQSLRLSGKLVEKIERKLQ